MRAMNWTALIKELTARGCGYQKIAEHCGTSRGTIYDLESGRSGEPRYGLGAALVDLHKRVMRRKKAA